jgi:hypothetical protein
MFSRVIGFVAAGLWGASAFCQVQPQIQIQPSHPGMNAAVDRALRELLKGSMPFVPRDIAPPACSIPLVEVPVTQNVEPMPVFRPLAEAFASESIQTTVPAPPCKENKEKTR